MPIKGIILIFAIAILVAVLERDAVYDWLCSVFNDKPEHEDDVFEDSMNDFKED